MLHKIKIAKKLSIKRRKCQIHYNLQLEIETCQLITSTWNREARALQLTRLEWLNINPWEHKVLLHDHCKSINHHSQILPIKSENYAFLLVFGSWITYTIPFNIKDTSSPSHLTPHILDPLPLATTTHMLRSHPWIFDTTINIQSYDSLTPCLNSL